MLGLGFGFVCCVGFTVVVCSWVVCLCVCVRCAMWRVQQCGWMADFCTTDPCTAYPCTAPCHHRPIVPPQEEGRAQFKLKFGVREGLPVSHAPRAVFREDEGKGVWEGGGSVVWESVGLDGWVWSVVVGGGSG